MRSDRAKAQRRSVNAIQEGRVLRRESHVSSVSQERPDASTQDEHHDWNVVTLAPSCFGQDHADAIENHHEH